MVSPSLQVSAYLGAGFYSQALTADADFIHLLRSTLLSVASLCSTSLSFASPPWRKPMDLPAVLG